MRDAVRRELESIEPLDALEREHRADALMWLASGAELSRLTKPATAKASGVLLRRRRWTTPSPCRSQECPALTTRRTAGTPKADDGGARDAGRARLCAVASR